MTENLNKARLNRAWGKPKQTKKVFIDEALMRPESLNKFKMMEAAFAPEAKLMRMSAPKSNNLYGPRKHLRNFGHNEKQNYALQPSFSEYARECIIKFASLE